MHSIMNKIIVYKKIYSIKSKIIQKKKKNNISSFYLTKLQEEQANYFSKEYIEKENFHHLIFQELSSPNMIWEYSCSTHTSPLLSYLQFCPTHIYFKSNDSRIWREKKYI